MRITQVEVESETDGSRMVCWVPSENLKIRLGSRLSLSEFPDEEIWRVVSVYSTQEHFDLKRKWNVGGLC
jgi:hypothetical protein